MLWRSYNSVALAQRSCALHRPAALAFAPDRSCCSVLESRQTVGTHSINQKRSTALIWGPVQSPFQRKHLPCPRALPPNNISSSYTGGNRSISSFSGLLGQSTPSMEAEAALALDASRDGVVGKKPAAKRRRAGATATEPPVTSTAAEAADITVPVSIVKAGSKKAVKAKAGTAKASAAPTIVAHVAGAAAQGAAAAAGSAEVLVVASGKKRKAPAKAAKAAPAAAGSTAAVIGSDGSVGVEMDAGDASPVPVKKGRAKKEAPQPLPYYSESMRPPSPDASHTKLICWNVAGLRAVLKKDPCALSSLVAREHADILLLQEHKLQEKDVQATQALLNLPDWHMAWSCSKPPAKLGYSGVAVLSRAAPLCTGTGLITPDTPDMQLGCGDDQEGRVVTAEFEHFYVVSVYVPNSGEGLRRLDYRITDWDKALSAHVRVLEARGKPVVVAGDMNCAHKEIDIHSPKTNLRSAGFTIEERDSFSTCYIDAGMVDTFRTQHPEVVAYTYFTYKFNCRAKLKGWRLDYFLVSPGLHAQCHDSFILTDVMGSDHVPLGLTLLLPKP